MWLGSGEEWKGSTTEQFCSIVGELGLFYLGFFILFYFIRLFYLLRHPPATNDCSYTWSVEQIFLGKHSTSIKLPLGFLLSGPEGKEIRERWGRAVPMFNDVYFQEGKGFSLSHKELGLFGGNNNSPTKLRAASLTSGVWFWWSIFFLGLLHHCPSSQSQPCLQVIDWTSLGHGACFWEPQVQRDSVTLSLCHFADIMKFSWIWAWRDC